MYVSGGAQDQRLLMQGLLKAQIQMARFLQPAKFGDCISDMLRTLLNKAAFQMLKTMANKNEDEKQQGGTIWLKHCNSVVLQFLHSSGYSSITIGQTRSGKIYGMAPKPEEGNKGGFEAQMEEFQQKVLEEVRDYVSMVDVKLATDLGEMRNELRNLTKQLLRNS
eukprot:Gb_26945 [translate_table: standard]